MSDVSPAVRMAEDLGGDEALDWTCADCGAEFSTERSFKLHQKHDHGQTDPFI